jgi:ubiquinone/menaquinone biosynthesis C-methylase UbiE
MQWMLIAVAALIAVYVAVLLWWRYASRRRNLPCPFWLSWLLTNPLRPGAGSAPILNRLDLKPGMRVLDVGCGPGRVSIPAAQRVGPEGEVVSLDIQEAMLKKLQQRAAACGVANIRTILGPAEEAALEADSCDRALLVWVLGEIQDQAAALRQILAALKPGGLLSITETLRDAHYQRVGTVLRLAESAGFCRGEYYKSCLSYTIHFVKPAAGSRYCLTNGCS